MDREGIHDFIRGTIQDYDTKDEGEWVMTHCPMAAWTHPHGSDRNMSFGIKVNEYDQSIYNCYTCKSKGTLMMLLEELGGYTGDNFDTEIEGLKNGELLNATLPEWGKRSTFDSKWKGLPDPVSNDYLDIYDGASDHKYLRARGIDNDTVERLGLVIDPDDKGHERILFPVFDVGGRFFGYTGRATGDGVEPRIRDYFGLPKRHLLLGAERIRYEYASSITLVEGLFDYARLSTFTVNICAVMHSGVTPQQAAILKDFGLPIYVMFDNDKAGQEGALQVKEVLGQHVPLMKVRYPKGKNDPGELSADEYYEMIEDARLL